MTPIRPSFARLTATTLAFLLVLTSAPAAVAQDPLLDPNSLLPTASVGAVQFGGVLAESEDRDADGDATLLLGTTVDGLALDGPRNAYTPTETAAFRLALPKALPTSTLRVNLVSLLAEGVEAVVGAGDWAIDPSWDTMTGTLPAPPIGEYDLRVYLAGALVASAPIATRDVPRVIGVVTDPLGAVADAAEQVSAASDRFAEATDGQLWLFVLDTTGGISATDYANDLWAVNEDQMWPGDALVVITTSDADVAVRVGDDLGFYVVPEEIVPIEDGARPLVAEGRYADAYDLAADGLVEAFDSPPPDAGSTPTPRPSPTPETVRTPDFVGLSRSDAQELADESDLRLRVEFEQTNEAPQGTVISQDPRSGRPVAIGGRVTITVASQPAQVPVPDVTGQQEDDAVNALLDAGLEPGNRAQRTSNSVRSGRIISTNPRAGVIVQRESTVDYVVSRGPAASPTPSPRPTATAGVVTVPDVRGLSEADALTELGAAGLRAGERTRRNSDRVDAGDVISTEPTRGVQVRRGTTVDYVVSRGPAPTPTPTPAPTRTPRPTPRPTATPSVVTVPDVRGLSEADALTELGAVGLRAGERTRRNSDRVDAGDVISTEPTRGVQVQRGTTVDYVVSRGPAPTPTPTPAPTRTPRPTADAVSVPQLRGMNEDDALTELVAAGLTPGERTRRFSSGVDRGDVITTDPSAGVQVARGSAVDYVVSRGPRPSPTATPAPTPTPTPEPTPSAEPTPDTGDLLARIQDAGQIVFNVDIDDAPWSSLSPSGAYRGYDVDVARNIARALGVEAVFTSYPMEQVVTGNWGGRFDIAIQHLAITDQRREVLDFSAPYAFDPTQLIATLASGITTLDGFANQDVCAAIASLGLDWIDGTLSLTDPPLEPLPVPEGMSVIAVSTEQECLGLDETTPEVGALISLPTAVEAIAAGEPSVAVGDPVFHAPIGAAFDRSGPDAGSLVAEVDAILASLRADGTLAERSAVRFDGLDLSVVPGGGPIDSVPPGGDPAFTVDTGLLDQFPTEVAGVAVTPLAMNGLDLERLLVPANDDIGAMYLPFLSLGGETGDGMADLGLVSAPIVTPDGSAMLTAARMEGVNGADLAEALTPLMTNQYQDPRSRSVTIDDRSVTRISDGPYTPGDSATFVYRRSGVVWFVTGTQPLVDEVLATLP